MDQNNDDSMDLSSEKENRMQIACDSGSTDDLGFLEMRPTTAEMLAELSLIDKEKPLSDKYRAEMAKCLELFGESWSEHEQIDFVKRCLEQMCHYQHGHIDAFLRPKLQRDFIRLLPERGLQSLAEKILLHLDAQALCACELVSRDWRRVVANGQLWRKLIERRVRKDPLWKGLSDRRGWRDYVFKPKDKIALAIGAALNLGADVAADFQQQHEFYRAKYPEIVRDIQQIENNWKNGNHILQRINCHSENSKGVYCLQYDESKIVSGLRDNTIKVWNRNSLACDRILSGHTGSVLCLQYDQNIIVSGSSDATVRVWSLENGRELNSLVHHVEAVLHLRFSTGMMVTCSKDRTIAVWDMNNPNEIVIRRVLVGHRAAVNVVDYDEKYIVSASGDRTIKVWSTDSCEFLRTLSGHRRGIACLQYRGRLVVSGSSDNHIRLWDIESGVCLRTLEGHEELVRCIRFDNKRIVSGAYDGKIKIWDLQAALDPRTPQGSICLKTLTEHTGRVFRLQFDEFQIVSSSHDDTILIWDFLNYTAPDSSARVEAPPPSPACLHQQPQPAIPMDNIAIDAVDQQMEEEGLAGDQVAVNNNLVDDAMDNQHPNENS